MAKSNGASRILSALLGCGDITQRHVQRADYWTSQVLMACQGYREVSDTASYDLTARHDALSWMMLRGVASGWVRDATMALGAGVTRRLWDVLIDGRSFAQIGASQYPHLSHSRSAGRVSAQFVMALEILDEYMSRSRKTQAKVCR